VIVQLLRSKEAPGADASAFWRFGALRALAGAIQVAMQRLDMVLVRATVGLAVADRPRGSNQISRCWADAFAGGVDCDPPIAR